MYCIYVDVHVHVPVGSPPRLGLVFWLVVFVWPPPDWHSSQHRETDWRTAETPCAHTYMYMYMYLRMYSHTITKIKSTFNLLVENLLLLHNSTSNFKILRTEGLLITSRFSRYTVFSSYIVGWFRSYM